MELAILILLVYVALVVTYVGFHAATEPRGWYINAAQNINRIFQSCDDGTE